ncbi:hypothetical protein MHTCC0001_27300 [Flavobacteriaceae bacterium MHTCC 0001]
MKIKIALFLLISLFVNSHHGYGQNYGSISYQKAVNISGKQRMLSQRIAKIKVLSALKPMTAKMKTEYTSSITLFERNLKILEENATGQSSKVRALVKQELSAWERFITKVHSPKASVKGILEEAPKLLSKCHELVIAIEEESKFTNELSDSKKEKQLRVETINISGKQRMLSQKLCLYYAASLYFNKYNRINEGEVATKIYRDIYNKMDAVVNDLMVNELNDSDIDITLSKILQLMEGEINDRRKDFMKNDIPLEKINLTSNTLLDLFNKLTSQYSLL